MDFFYLPENFSIISLTLCMMAFMIAGFIDAIAGGGGLIVVPSLLLSGLPPHVVLGTGKLASSIGTLTALLTYFKSHVVVTRLVPMGFLSAFIGSAFGAYLALLIDSSTLGKVMVILLPIAMIFSLFGAKKTANSEKMPDHAIARTFVIGFVTGTYDGFFGPAGGTFMIIALNLVLWIDLVRASGTAKVLNLASNLGALCTFASSGMVAYGIAIPCALASIIGNYAGARYAVKIGPSIVRKFLYTMITVLTCTLFYKFFIGSGH